MSIYDNAIKPLQHLLAATIVLGQSPAPAIIGDALVGQPQGLGRFARLPEDINRKVADTYEIEIAPSFVLQRKDKVLWEKTGKLFPGELRDVIEMFKS